VNRSLSAPTVPTHPAITQNVAGHQGTPVEISPDKTSNLPRAPAASTKRPLDDIGLRHAMLARPDRLASNAIRVPRVAISPPASFPPRLTTTQLPLTCGWCHQPPHGTHTRELLAMLGVHRGAPRPRIRATASSTARPLATAHRGAPSPRQTNFRSDLSRLARTVGRRSRGHTTPNRPPRQETAVPTVSRFYWERVVNREPLEPIAPLR